MLVGLEGRCSRIRSGSGAALHNWQGIEGSIASMYRKPKEILAGEASQQLYFTKAAAMRPLRPMPCTDCGHLGGSARGARAYDVKCTGVIRLGPGKEH